MFGADTEPTFTLEDSISFHDAFPSSSPAQSDFLTSPRSVDEPFDGWEDPLPNDMFDLHISDNPPPEPVAAPANEHVQAEPASEATSDSPMEVNTAPEDPPADNEEPANVPPHQDNMEVDPPVDSRPRKTAPRKRKTVTMPPRTLPSRQRRASTRAAASESSSTDVANASRKRRKIS